MESEQPYFEDACIEDIGLTWVLSKRTVLDSLSAEDVELYPYDGPEEMWLRLAESAVDTFDRTKARQLGQDIDRLASPRCRTRRCVRCGSGLCSASSTRPSTVWTCGRG